MPLSRTRYGMHTNRAATAALPPSWQGYRLGPARPCFSSVTPAKAGSRATGELLQSWIPAFAGMTIAMRGGTGVSSLRFDVVQASALTGSQARAGLFDS